MSRTLRLALVCSVAVCLMSGCGPEEQDKEPLRIWLHKVRPFAMLAHRVDSHEMDYSMAAGELRACFPPEPPKDFPEAVDLYQAASDFMSPFEAVVQTSNEVTAEIVAARKRADTDNSLAPDEAARLVEDTQNKGIQRLRVLVPAMEDRLKKFLEVYDRLRQKYDMP